MFDVDKLATQLVSARVPGGAQVATPKALPASAADAYRVQDAVCKAVGPVGAWKVGAPTPTAEPTCAPILATGVDSLAGRTAVAGRPFGVELEIAVRLGRAFPAAKTAPSRADVLAGVKSAHIAFETCVPRIADSVKAPPLVMLSDNGINHGLILGPEVANWTAVNIKTLEAHVDIDGNRAVTMTGAHSQGDIAALLVWLVGHCVTQRGGLADGTVVTTGSFTGIHFVHAPARVSGTLMGLGTFAFDLFAPRGTKHSA